MDVSLIELLVCLVPCLIIIPTSPQQIIGAVVGVLVFVLSCLFICLLVCSWCLFECLTLIFLKKISHFSYLLKWSWHQNQVFWCWDLVSCVLKMLIKSLFPKVCSKMFAKKKHPNHFNRSVTTRTRFGWKLLSISFYFLFFLFHEFMFYKLCDLLHIFVFLLVRVIFVFWNKTILF